MSNSPPDHRFHEGEKSWQQGLGMVRNVVRQELVHRQISAHLGDAPLRVLDAGCGQGTQALHLARLGHQVLGIDVSDDLLDAAARAADGEEPEVRARLTFQRGDLLALGPVHAGRYDLVCCHGVAMYLPSLDAVVRALVGAARPGGLVSLLTRNRAGIAMRAGMSGDWSAAMRGFAARHYDNRIGIESVRADEPAEVQATLDAQGVETITWYGVRLFTDHWGKVEPGEDLPSLLDAEEEAGRRDPYRAVAALTHTIGRVRGG